MLEFLNEPPLWLALNLVGLSAVVTMLSIMRERSIERALVGVRSGNE